MLNPVCAERLDIDEEQAERLLAAIQREITRLEFAGDADSAAHFKFVADWMEK